MGTHPIFESDFDCLTEMGNLFGKEKKKSQVTELDRAVLELKKQRDKMKKAQLQIEKEAVETKAKVLALMKSNDKTKALKLLKRKRAIENRADKIEKNLENVQGLINQIKETQEQQAILKALDSGNKAMGELHKLMSLSDAERIMDESAEQREIAAEIDNLISGAVTADDEAEINAELYALLSDATELSSLPTVPNTEPIVLPNVPDSKVQEEDNREAELVPA